MRYPKTQLSGMQIRDLYGRQHLIPSQSNSLRPATISHSTIRK